MSPASEVNPNDFAPVLQPVVVEINRLSSAIHILQETVDGLLKANKNKSDRLSKDKEETHDVQ